MEPDVVTFLEQLFEAGFVWDEAELAHSFGGVRLRLAMGEVPEPLRREVEAVIYPRLWKVLEAVRAGLPEGEQRARVHVLNRRLARLLATEADVV